MEQLGLERFSARVVAADLNVPTLCDTLQTGGRRALDDVLKEAGVVAMGPRIRIANALFELPGYSCKPSGDVAEPGASGAASAAAPAIATTPVEAPTTTEPTRAAAPASAAIGHAARPDPAHLGKSIEMVLADHSPSMLEYKNKFDEAKVDLQMMCEIRDQGGKWAIMDKLSAIGIDVRPGHPRPRYKLAVDLDRTCRAG